MEVQDKIEWIKTAWKMDNLKVVSVGAFQGFITIATYSQKYVDFLYGVNTIPVTSSSLMKMHEHIRRRQ